MLADSHCHLNFHAFDEDRQAVIDRARQAGVGFILNPAIDLPTSRQAIALAEQYPEMWAAVGVHPNDARTWDDNALAELRDMAQHPKVVAIGEIGLDYYWDEAPPDLQRRIFGLQLELAAEAALPVVIHSRDKVPASPQAVEDLLEILSAWQAGLERSGSTLAGRPGVLHSFSYSEAVARRALEAGFFIGVTGPVTFKKAEDLHSLAAGLPLDHLLVETDAPFLTPHPHRGRRNEPAYVKLVAEKIAQLRGLPFETVGQATAENVKALFLPAVSS